MPSFNFASLISGNLLQRNANPLDLLFLSCLTKVFIKPNFIWRWDISIFLGSTKGTCLIFAFPGCMLILLVSLFSHSVLQLHGYPIGRESSSVSWILRAFLIKGRWPLNLHIDTTCIHCTEWHWGRFQYFCKITLNARNVLWGQMALYCHYGEELLQGFSWKNLGRGATHLLCNFLAVFQISLWYHNSSTVVHLL